MFKPRPASGGRRRFQGWFAVGVVVVLVAAAATRWRPTTPKSAFSEQSAVLTRGAKIYAEKCSLCHGATLQGQPIWQTPGANGRMPAPPLNSDGHAWHHDSATLTGIVKYGLVPPWAPSGYRSDMPAFVGRLSDEDVWAVLSFIAGSWSSEASAWQHQIETQNRPQ